MSPSDQPTTLCAAFHRTVLQRPGEVALRLAGGGPACTWIDYARRAAAYAGALAGAGVRAEDSVALLLTNRPEFHFADTAALHLRAVPFSLYPLSSPQQLAHVLAHSAARVVVTERRLAPALAGLGVPLLLVDDDADFAADGMDLAAAAGAVRPDDLLTLVYTSGTTGAPKGVEVTHAAMTAMVAATAPPLGVRAGDRMISFLPAAHIADRWASHYFHLWAGTELTCLPDIRDLAATLVEVRPTLFGGVPQVWQRIVTGLRNLPDPQMRAAVDRSVEIGQRYQRAVTAGEVSDEIAMLHRAAEQRVLGPLRERLGLDRVRVAVTGAAACPPELIEYVTALGIPLVEAWGMSEVCGTGAMVPPGVVRPGTVGPPVDGLEVRLAGDGELLVRGPMVMRGYRNDPAATAAAIDTGGWLHTGDLAAVGDDGYLTIAGRKKDLIITSAGENVAPSAVELALTAHGPLLAQAVVAGDDRPYLTALLVVDPEAVSARGLKPDDPAVREAVDAGVAAANAGLSRAEQVRAYAVLTDPWTPGGDLVTATMKVRRHVVLDRYATTVDGLYAADRP